jgi:thiol-disulfide isomerase/thioredoxin
MEAPAMQNEHPDNAGAPAPEIAVSVTRRRAWIGMAAVALALAMLAMIPEPGASDPNAPPPAADGGDAAEPESNMAVGMPAPLHFTLKDMNGIEVKLESFRGKVILMNFWATWCGPCRVEIPDLIALQKQYADDLVVLGVSVDDSADKMQSYASTMKINYPLLVGLGRDDVQDAFGPLWGIPVSVFIDREGKIHKKHSGIASREQIEREIMSAL